MDMYSIDHKVQNGDCWLRIVRMAVDTNGHWAHGSSSQVKSNSPCDYDTHVYFITCNSL